VQLEKEILKPTLGNFTTNIIV